METPLDKMSIDELLAEKTKTEEALREARSIVGKFESDLFHIRQAINKLKQPNAGTSIQNRLKNFAVPTKKQQINQAFDKMAEQIDAKKPKKKTYTPSISEHAVVRYLERIMGFDIDGVRDQIMTKEIKDALSLGVTRVCVNGVDMIAAEGKIITIINSD